jgi:hypothetical protein
VRAEDAAINDNPAQQEQENQDPICDDIEGTVEMTPEYEAGKIFGVPDCDGLKDVWADPVAFIRQKQRSWLTSVRSETQQEALDSAIESARSKLAEDYCIPNVTEGMNELEEVVESLNSKFSNLMKESWEPEVNQNILLMCKEFDVENTGCLDFQTMSKFVMKLFFALKIGLDPKSVKLILRVIDVDGDGMFSYDEIVRKYNREERKQWFAD